MKFYPTSSITLFSFLLFVNSLSANYAFKKKVKSVCKTYRITVDSEHFELGDDTFFIDLESGRNNFEMFMVVGFAAAGQAVAHQKQMGLTNAYLPANIQVSVRVPTAKDAFNTFVATCSWEMANKLAEGSIDSAEFMQTITKNLKII
tara:strand:+ start:4742 stop:5182 length:441 start_codon:yes stop_codon:yes gene_type:complete